jgi:hypothetical protein
MEPFDQSLDQKPAASNWFKTTHWTEVLSAGRADSAQANSALNALCQGYWPPLYAYVRRLGHSKEEAEDLTQDSSHDCWTNSGWHGPIPHEAGSATSC